MLVILLLSGMFLVQLTQLALKLHAKFQISRIHRPVRNHNMRNNRNVHINHNMGRAEAIRLRFADDTPREQ